MTEQSKQDLLNAQVAVLGCLLIDPARTAGHIMAEISESDFRDPTYRAIFSAMRGLFGAGKPIDPITVADAVGQGHVALLAQIIDCTPTAVHFAEYCELLKKRALLSRLQSCGVGLMDAATPEECEPLLQQAMEALALRPGIKVYSMSDILTSFYERHSSEKTPVYLSWGIDELTSSLFIEPGDMTIIGGRPSAGKTSLALFFAYHMAQKGHRVCFFSYETGQAKLGDRLVAMEAQVAMPRLKLNTMTEQDWENVAAVSGRMTGSSLDFIENCDMSVQQIRALVVSRRYDVIFVDYLQLIDQRLPGKNATAFDRVSEVSLALKRLGRQTGAAVVALSQLSRPEKSKSGKIPPPTLADLRQSGQLEQDADAVMLLYLEKPDDRDSRRILNIAKNKEGERNIGLYLMFDGETQTFRKSAAQQPRPKQATPDWVKAAKKAEAEEPAQQLSWPEEHPEEWSYATHMRRTPTQNESAGANGEKKG